MDAQIKNYLENPDLDIRDRDRALELECGKADGQSSSRVAVAITEVFRGKRDLNSQTIKRPKHQ